MNYDAVWITTSSNACRTPTVDDIVLGTTYDSSELFYKQMPDGAILLFLPWEIDIPKDFPYTVRYNEVHPTEWDDIKKRNKSGEIKRLKLDLPESDPCFIRWNR